MMMKRWICFVAGTILAAGMMAGCGSSGNEQEQGMSQAAADMAKAGAPGTEGTVTISYGCWDSNQGELLRTVADEFEKENPNIKIDIQVNSWDNYWTALEAAATGGSLPDTFWMHSNNIY